MMVDFKFDALYTKFVSIGRYSHEVRALVPEHSQANSYYKYKDIYKKEIISELIHQNS